MHLTIQERYSTRELDRQISSGIYERTMLGNAKLSPSLRELSPGILNSFRDDYILEFLGLPDSHSEGDLQKGLISQMKNFILELGKDFFVYWRRISGSGWE